MRLNEKQVKNVQDLLRVAGYDPGPTDGIFGPKTQAAVKAFQEAQGLRIDGVVGPKTSLALTVACLKPAIDQVPETPNAVAMIAQAAHETGRGLNLIRTPEACSWNWFNIKGRYQGRSFTVSTWEVVGGQTVQVDAEFRAYPSSFEAGLDYLELLKGERYREAWAVRQDSLAYIAALHRAGYATDPQYVAKVGAVAIEVAGMVHQEDWKARALAAEETVRKIRELAEQNLS